MSQTSVAGRRVVIPARGIALLEEYRWPLPAPGEVLVRNEATLVSPGTELALFEGTHAGLPDPANTFAKYPFYPGYAAIGEVCAVGRGVVKPRIGQRVFHCGAHGTHGCFDPEQAVWCEVPSVLADEAMLLLRLVQIATTATHVWRRRPGRALVLGAGLVGIFAAQVLQLIGVREVAIQDLNTARLALAGRCGVARTLHATDNLVPAVPNAFGGHAPDCVIEATGVPALVSAALSGVARGGDVVLLGSPRGGIEIGLYEQIHRHGTALIGAHEALLPARAAGDRPSRQQLLEQAIAWALAGRLKLRELISHRIGAEALPSTYAQIAKDKSGTLGVAIDWSEKPPLSKT